MRVFVVGTGRCGTKTFSHACKHITNYTSAHESPFSGSLTFPEQHIEISPHLSWVLGPLAEHNSIGDTLFVHLQRKREDVIKSWMGRGRDSGPGRWTPLSRIPQGTDAQWEKACGLCYDSMVSQINMFLDSTCDFYMHIWLHELEEKWPKFWKAIGAQGDYQYSLKELKKKYNAS